MPVTAPWSSSMYLFCRKVLWEEPHWAEHVRGVKQDTEGAPGRVEQSIYIYIYLSTYLCDYLYLSIYRIVCIYQWSIYWLLNLFTHLSIPQLCVHRSVNLNVLFTSFTCLTRVDHLAGATAQDLVPVRGGELGPHGHQARQARLRAQDGRGRHSGDLKMRAP